MRYLGIAPFHTTNSKINYIIPSIISIFHIICLLCRFVCWAGNRSRLSFTRITFCIETALLQICFFVIFKTCVKQDNCWKVLESEALESHVHDRSRLFYKMLVAALNVFYLFMMLSEYLYGLEYDISCRMSWILVHESHYLNFILIYFLLEYLLIFQQSYKELNRVLIDVCRKASTKNISVSINNTSGNSELWKIRRKFSKQHMVLQHFSKVFGSPMCMIFIYLFVTYITNLGFLFFEGTHLNFIYRITTTGQLIFLTVS